MVLKAGNNDTEVVFKLAQRLWPECEDEEIMRKVNTAINSDEAVVFIYSLKEKIVGFAMCNLCNDFVEGTTSSPVGYLRGIYVKEKYRRSGIATELLEECEQWAKKNGCSEFASDCKRGNTDTFLFHLKNNYEEVNRIICFKKNI